MDITLKLAHEVTDEELSEIWEKFGTKQRVLFSGEDVASPADFAQLARANSAIFFVVYVSGKQAAVSWLNGWEGYAARGHQAFFKDFYGSSVMIAREVAAQMFEMQRVDGTPMVKTIIGLTPVPNRLAIRFARKVGFVPVMEVPDACVWQGQSCAGLLSYLNKEVLNGV